MKYFFLAILIFGGFQMTANAQTTAITDLRQKIVEAIELRDQKTLENLYADDFTHTHASGQVDDKTKRIAALVSGDLTIESAPVDEIKIRFYGRNTAIANGRSTIENQKYCWTVVYFKTGKTWRVVASQATKIAEK